MLPAVHRMRLGEEFARAVRRGRRSGSPLLAVHFTVPADADAGPARVGVVVSRAVGTAVVRTRVKRRLRAQAQARLDLLPAGSLTVLRANPAAATATSSALGADLDRALLRVLPQALSRGART